MYWKRWPFFLLLQSTPLLYSTWRLKQKTQVTPYYPTLISGRGEIIKNLRLVVSLHVNVVQIEVHIHGIWFFSNLSNYIVIHCVKKSLKRSVVGMGFIKGQAVGNLTGCEDNFAWLV